VGFTGADIHELMEHAERMRMAGGTGDERYDIVMRVLKRIVKTAQEREAKVLNFSNLARLQETSTGVFKRDQYERLELQINSLKSLLAKQPAISAQLNTMDPAIPVGKPDGDPCAKLTDLMAVQIIPSQVDFKTIKKENEEEFERERKETQKMLKNTIKRYQKKDKPLPLSFRLAKARLSDDVLNLQQKLRQDIANSLDAEQIVKGIFRPPHVVESNQRQREKINRRNRIKENKRKEKARKEFLHHVCTQHRKVFNSFHRDQRKTARALAKAVIKELAHKQRKKEEQEKYAKNARLKALREKDEKKYMELLMEAKNERLIDLLRKTEEYMEKIGATIQAEQEKSKQLRGIVDENDEDSDDKGDSEEDGSIKAKQGLLDIAGTRKRYYNVAHKYKEIVTEQPKALVFGKLRGYQMAGLQWLVSLYNNNLNGILADEMGLGKTIQSISLLAYVMEKKKNNGPFLVIAPMSTLHNNWAYELQRWVPSMVSIVYDGSKEARKKLREEDMATENYNVLLTTFEFAMRDKKYLRKTNWQYIIVDEAHRLKNPKCKLVSDLNEYSKGARRIALSGTPLQNDLPELWSLLNFLHPSIFNSCDNFQQWFAAPLEKNLGADGNQDMDMNEEEKLLVIDRLHSILRPFVLRREKKEVESQLQDKVDVVLRCKMAPVQRALYDAIASGKISMHNRMVQLRKICNHPYLFHPYCRGVPNSYRYLIDNDLINLCCKFRLLDIILPKFKAKGHRVLLFNQMTKSMDIIGHYLEYRKYRYLRLDGMTAAPTRAHNLRLFNAKDSPYFMFILSTKAGGLGLNLQSADTVILFDSDWNPQNDLQAQARAHRIGQLAKVISIRFVTVDTIEEKVLQTANNKRDVEAMVIQAGGFNKDHDANEASEMVKSVLRRGQDDDIEVSDLDFINRSIARDDEEYEYYTKMDEKDTFKQPPQNKFPLWVWDFLKNGSRASDTRQELVTHEEACTEIRVIKQVGFPDPTLLLGKRKSRKRQQPEQQSSDDDVKKKAQNAKKKAVKRAREDVFKDKKNRLKAENGKTKKDERPEGKSKVEKTDKPKEYGREGDQVKVEVKQTKGEEDEIMMKKEHISARESEEEEYEDDEDDEDDDNDLIRRDANHVKIEENHVKLEESYTGSSSSSSSSKPEIKSSSPVTLDAASLNGSLTKRSLSDVVSGDDSDSDSERQSAPKKSRLEL